MGRIEKDGDEYVYRQADGEITARFDSIEEKMELAHEGQPLYKKVFHVLVFLGACYLGFILYMNMT